jgi:hypothetical protein
MVDLEVPAGVLGDAQPQIVPSWEIETLLANREISEVRSIPQEIVARNDEAEKSRFRHYGTWAANHALKRQFRQMLARVAEEHDNLINSFAELYNTFSSKDTAEQLDRLNRRVDELRAVKKEWDEFAQKAHGEEAVTKVLESLISRRVEAMTDSLFVKKSAMFWYGHGYILREDDYEDIMAVSQRTGVRDFAYLYDVLEKFYKLRGRKSATLGLLLAGPVGAAIGYLASDKSMSDRAKEMMKWVDKQPKPTARS